MSDFFYRSESIKKEDLSNFFVESETERDIINLFKSKSHVVLEGSRGSGKSFLMKMAQKEMMDSYTYDKILPIYITFASGRLVNSNDPNQFYHWMLAKILKETLKVFQKTGLLISQYSKSLLGDQELGVFQSIVQKFEVTYKNPSQKIDISSLPELNDIMDAIEEVCSDNDVDRIVLFFDESAHVFRPEQQRQFFTLFRDLKTPYISCNAAVYPGVTHYGNSFEMTHDALHKRIDRDILSPTYLEEMTQMVKKQGGDKWANNIDNKRDSFNSLVFSAGGNPRLLLKTLDKCQQLRKSIVNDVIRKFYRSDIWLEHTQLGEKYKGHKAIVDWGRKFIEDKVIPLTYKKNENDKNKGKRSTIYFWISKDAPEQIKEALRLLSYTGIIRKYDSGVKATKSNIGDRYEIKFGCLLTQYSSPTETSKEIIPNVQLDMFTEFGKNSPSFSTLPLEEFTDFTDTEFLNSLRIQLAKPITELDLTDWQKEKLNSINILSIEELLESDEKYLIDNLEQVGPVRARLMKNSATAELLESISG